MGRQDEDRVRVRFAPSPTGYLHVGGARTAIFNWLFAASKRGTFVLRVEDTDLERSTRESEASLIEDLRWLGLDWQEGPLEGGPHAPYRQSERLDIYSRHAARLIADGAAYPCFCDDATLESKREAARRAGRPPHYDGTCRKLDDDGIAARRADGAKEVIRFRVREGTVAFRDLIRGGIDLDTNTVGDFVILRSNGRPTYNFAAAIDDHEMGITHVLRGEEHLPNTMRQLLVYEATHATPPHFAHLPLILAEDRSKLSKRHGASSVGDLRALGLLPDAVVNYLVLLGWSHPDGKEVMDRDEMTRHFTLERVNKSAAVYDRKKLNWMSGQHIRLRPPESLIDAADLFFDDDARSTYDRSRRVKILRLLQDSIETLSDLRRATAVFRMPPEMDDDATDALAAPSANAVLGELARALGADASPLDPSQFKALMKSVGKAVGAKGKELFFPVRAALTGSVHGPDLAGVAEVRGRANVIELIERAREASPPR